MDILPEVLCNVVDDYVLYPRTTFDMVMRELLSCVKYYTHNDGEDIRIDIKWIGYTPKENIDVEPFLSNVPLFDTKLAFKSKMDSVLRPHFKIYVPYRQLHSNDSELTYRQKEKVPEVLQRRCERFKCIKRASYYIILHEH